MFGRLRSQMAVKVDDTDWTVGTVDTTEQRESDGVVAT
jgi:hypothetical protein